MNRISVPVLMLASLAGIASGQIKIDFHNSTSTEAAMAPASAPTAQGSVVNTSAETWNHVTNASTTTFSFNNIALKSVNGTSSGATLSGTSGYAGNNTNDWATRNKDSVMMEGWFGLAGTESISVSNLPSSYASGFHVIVYGDANDSSGRTMNYRIGSTTRTIQDTGTFNGSYLEGKNYVVFTGLTGTSFTLNGNTATPRSAVNGIAIMPGNPPQPPSIASFNVNDRYVPAGTSVTLSWQCPGAETVTITPGIGTVAAQGTTNVTVAATTTYTLTAGNAQGQVSQTLRVGVGPERPNILVFLVDDMGWQDCSLPFYFENGQPVRTTLNQRYRTPNLEALAARGLRFTNASAHPVCSPSRVTLMTGMHAARHHVTNWTYPLDPRQTDQANTTLNPPPAWRTAGMDADDLAFPKLLQEAGYRTIHSGKAHFGPMAKADGVTPNPSGDPRFLGFDVNIAGWGAGGPGSYASGNQYGTAALWHVPGLEDYYTPVNTNTHLTEALTLEINKSIEESVQHGQPFFAYMSHYAIHAPYEIDSRFSANYPGLSGTMLGHATLIEGMDKSLGDILRKLENLGVAENTLVLFLGDNGAESPNTSSLPNPSAPLKGRKGTRFEGGTRVPFVAAWAKSNASNPFQGEITIPANAHDDDIVTLEDIFPTMLDIAGVPAVPTDGKSLLPYFKGDSQYHRPQEFITHFPHAHNGSFYSTLRQGNWKLIHNYLNRSWELYDLTNDIGEANNLATNPTPENAMRLMRMARHLARELQRYDAQFPTEDATGNARGLLMPDLPLVDSDGDGIPDVGEDANRNGLVDPGETNADNDNTDGDGTKDGDEKRTGTNPLDATSYFRALPRTNDTNGLLIEWPSKPGASYRVESSDHPGASEWDLEAPAVPAANPGNATQYNWPHLSEYERRFFRVRLN